MATYAGSTLSMSLSTAMLLARFAPMALSWRMAAGFATAGDDESCLLFA